MTSPGLSRRVERAEEDLTAISDIVLEIKDTVDRHTDTLAAHGSELTAIRQAQDQQGEVLAQHSATLAQHGELLVEILRRLDAR